MRRARRVKLISEITRGKTPVIIEDDAETGVPRESRAGPKDFSCTFLSMRGVG
jgi:hypothetical protein